MLSNWPKERNERWKKRFAAASEMDSVCVAFGKGRARHRRHRTRPVEATAFSSSKSKRRVERFQQIKDEITGGDGVRSRKRWLFSGSGFSLFDASRT